MSDSTKSGRRGVSLLNMLAVLFIGLKLAGLIDWPWWLVLAPLWGGLLLWFAVTFVLLLVYFVADQHIDGRK